MNGQPYSRADKVTLVVGGGLMGLAASILLVLWGVLPL